MIFRLQVCPLHILFILLQLGTDDNEDPSDGKTMLAGIFVLVTFICVKATPKHINCIVHSSKTKVLLLYEATEKVVAALPYL